MNPPANQQNFLWNTCDQISNNPSSHPKRQLKLRSKIKNPKSTIINPIRATILRPEISPHQVLRKQYWAFLPVSFSMDFPTAKTPRPPKEEKDLFSSSLLMTIDQ
jgi:hypothetical protein